MSFYAFVTAHSWVWPLITGLIIAVIIALIVVFIFSSVELVMRIKGSKAKPREACDITSRRLP